LIYIVGDTHGDIEFWKLSNKEFRKQGLEIPTKNDTIIHVGDLGFVWDPADKISKSEEYLKKWSGKKPWTLITAGGNHENWDRVLKLPLVPWPGGELAYKYTDNIYYAIRGGTYEIEGKTFFFMGGASSHDKAYRTEGLSWWDDEIPSMKEMDQGVTALDKVQMEVDYVITHTFPWEVIQVLHHSTSTCPVASYLNQLLRFGLKFKDWYGGHFHLDQTVDTKYGNFHCIYDKIIKI
jgi:hypothetical protein